MSLMCELPLKTEGTAPPPARSSGQGSRHGRVIDEQRPALVAFEGDLEAVQVVYFADDPLREHVEHGGAGSQMRRGDGSNDRVCGEVQHSDLMLARTA